jgi:dTDP-4-amino-4,6-dideoxygalactose transaminase
MPEIMDVCAAWNIEVIEDAAESLGSYLAGRHSGVFGRAAILSFNGNKIVTTGGGGMIITSDASLAAHARHLSTTAKQAHAWEFNHDLVGYNYRMPNLNAAVGCAQMERLSTVLADKRATTGLYHDFFTGLGIESLIERSGTACNYWLNGFYASNRQERDAFLAQANANGVQARPVWTLMPRLPMYSQCSSGPCPNARWVEERLINIPSSVRLPVA